MAAFANGRGELFGHLFDEIEQVDTFGGGANGLVGDARRAQANVAFDGAGEEIGVLQDDAEVFAEVGEVKDLMSMPPMRMVPCWTS